MNQIPNIEETHPWWNRLEEALSQKDEYKFCKVDATDLEFAIKDYKRFHQQLQKAREEERKRIGKLIVNKASLVENPIETPEGTVDGSFYQIYRGDIEQVINHSELDEDKK